MSSPYNAKNAVSVSCEIHHTVHWRLILLSFILWALILFFEEAKGHETAKTHVFHALFYILEAVRCCSILLFHFAPKRIRPPPYPICEFLWKRGHRSPYFFSQRL